MSMGDTYLISGLLTKRAEMAGELSKLRQRMDAIAHDLAAVDRLLKAFGYQGEPEEDICPVVKRETVTRRGSLANDALDILREASEPMSAAAVADIIATRRGLQLPTARQRETFREHVRQSMRRLRQKGVLELLGTGNAVVWRVKP
ncbi:hypothetical protein [Rhodocista pekingensis]|uniref:DUF3489 domain-containing protein n=1 Tax=Rhodocista pekingensis TaxID=201185 RepID=A0ABW2KYB3_9PROT